MSSNVPRLIVRDSSGAERSVEISRTPFTLGRQGDNDLVVLDNRISRRHARILRSADEYVIEDTDSRHGTFVNGERITSHVLRPGDQICLGVMDSSQISFATDEAALPGLLQKFEEAVESPAPQLQHLSLLLQMAQMLNRAPALEQVLTTLVDSALQLTDADRGMLFLREDDGGLRLTIARGRGGVYLPADLVQGSRSAAERVMKSGRQEVLLEDDDTGRATPLPGVPPRAGGMVAVPLQKLPLVETGGETITLRAPEVLGVLCLESQSRAASLTGLDREVLQTLATEGATVIENARMFRLTREQERIQHELSVARRIQQGLLPKHLPQSRYFKLYATTMPCRTVGGDYFDIIVLPEDRFGLTVADVSGKGTGAAMLAAMLQGAFAAFAATDPTLPDLFRSVNNFLCERTPAEMYATVFYGVIHPIGEFTFVNAGHAPPLIVRATGAIDCLGNSSFPLGIFSGAEYPDDTARLNPGDLVLIFSDGVTEAQDVAGDLFGENRLTEALKDCAGKPPEQVCAQVLAAVEQFAAGAPQADDLTLTALRYDPQ